MSYIYRIFGFPGFCHPRARYPSLFCIPTPRREFLYPPIRTCTRYGTVRRGALLIMKVEVHYTDSRLCTDQPSQGTVVYLCSCQIYCDTRTLDTAKYFLHTSYPISSPSIPSYRFYHYLHSFCDISGSFPPFTEVITWVDNLKSIVSFLDSHDPHYPSPQ